MSLSPETIALLRDEAYLALCRQALTDAFAEANSKLQQIRETRPPFGLLATRKTKEVFERSLQEAMEGETSLQNRLDKVEMLSTWVRSELRPQLHGYLWQVAPEYRHGADVRAALNRVGNQIDPYAEALQAYARDLRSLVHALVGAVGGTVIARAISDLRNTIQHLDAQTLQFELNCQRVTRTTEGSLFADIRTFPSPLPTQMATIERIVRLDDAQLLEQAQLIEANIRTLLATGIAEMRVVIEAARDRVAQIESEYLEKYWQQLRTYAEQHYVTERDLDEVLMEISERYIAQRRQDESQQCPYLNER